MSGIRRVAVDAALLDYLDVRRERTQGEAEWQGWPDEAGPEAPPHDPEAEWSLLAGLFKRPALLRQVPLDPAAFYGPRARTLARGMARVAGSGQPLNGPSLLRALWAEGISDAAERLADLDLSPRADEAPRYAERVQEAQRRRRLVDAAQRLAEAAWNLSRPFDLADALTLLRQASEPPTARPAGRQLLEGG